MNRHQEENEMNLNQNQASGSDRNLNKKATNLEGNIDNGRISMERPFERFERGNRNQHPDSQRQGSDYYSERDEKRRFSMEGRGWHKSGMRSANPSVQNNLRQSDFRSADFDYADTSSDNRLGFFGKGPKGWEVTDKRILNEACEALYRDTEVDASDIEVTVKDGCVFLRGTVETRGTKKYAEECVENLIGVCDVQNELKVTNRSTHGSNQ